MTAQTKSLIEELRDTIEMTAQTTDQAPECIDALREHATNLAKRLDDLEYERDDAESEKSWAEDHLVPPEDVEAASAKAFARAIEHARDVERGLISLPEMIDRLQREDYER